MNIKNLDGGCSLAGNVARHINKDIQQWARLAIGWVTI